MEEALLDLRNWATELKNRLGGMQWTQSSQDWFKSMYFI